MRIINIPNYYNSKCQISFGGNVYTAQFMYNDECDIWTFSMFDVNDNVVIAPHKIVPNFPLNYDAPVASISGVFMCITNKTRIEKKSFVSGEAIFCYVPYAEMSAEVADVFKH